MMSTALQAAAMLVLSVPADAQPAPNARPLGGSVMAGSAAISTTATNTQINQSTQRAAIEWQSFNVGSQQSVTFSQPSSSAVALNRVTGPDPSQIAGRIDANGQVIVVNQSGVNFYKGAQVNTAGLIVATANVTNQNFMAGKLKFDQPGKPGAAITNAGNITVKQAGLAALVAPQVANSGTITAKLGHVVLAGAKTATLDLYGDGLLSLDVTNQVTEAPGGKAALVTNTGVIAADGGTVQLSARAADGIVQNLVEAGGRISAATVGGRSGTIALNGVGGSILVAGQLDAPGAASGSAGGAIEVVSDHDVTLASTARIDASGRAGGGVVAIGTTLARARSRPGVAAALTAKTVTMQQGATIAADATDQGNGGRVAVLASGTTQMDGAISARGGVHGGNGGFAEVSGGTLGITGSIDLSTPLGNLGTILLDPTFLDVVPGAAGAGALDSSFSGGTLAAGASNVVPNTVSNGEIQSLGSFAAVVLQTSTGTIGVHAPIRVLGGLSLEAGSDLLIDRGVSITAGSLFLSSGTNIVGGTPTLATGSILIGTTGSLGPVSLSAPTVVMQAGSASFGHPAIDLSDSIVNNGTATPATLVQLNAANGGISQSSAGIVDASRVDFGGTITSGITLAGTANTFTESLSTITGLINGNMVLVDKSNLALGGPLNANNLFVEVTKTGGTLTLGFVPVRSTFAPAVLTVPTGGRISLVADNYAVTSPPPSFLPSSIIAPSGTLELAPFVASGATSTASQLLASGLLPILNVGTTPLSTLVLGGFTNLPAGAAASAPSAKDTVVDTTFNLSGIASALDLEAVDTVSQSAPLINVGTLLGLAGSATLTNPGNLIGTLGAFNTTAGFALVDDQPLLVLGPVVDSGAASKLALTTLAGGITLAGDVSAANVLDLTSAGAINQTGGTLFAGTLTGSAAAAATLTNSNQVATLGNFSASSLALNDATNLLIAGTVDAAHMRINAPASQVTLANGATIITAGTTRPFGPLQPGLEPANGAPGAVVQAAGFTQIGSSTVLGQGVGPATVQISTTGNVQFDPLLGLSATGTWLILNLTTGTAGGNIFVDALDVAYTTPGSTNLFGTISGITGGSAAASGNIQPAINANFLFNNCVIASQVCQIITSLPRPPTSPTRFPDAVFTSTLGGILQAIASPPPTVANLPVVSFVALPMLQPRPPQLTDPDVVPPNVSYLDY
jgi:filamentous hemagglutinin family protein